MIPILVKRDFNSRVRGTAYIITTIIGVLVFIGVSFLPPLINHFAGRFTATNIDLLVYEEQNEPSVLPYLAQVSEGRKDVRIRDSVGMDEKQAYQVVLDEGLTGLLLIDGPLFTLVTTDGTNVTLNTELESLINRAVTLSNAVRLGLSDQDLGTLFQKVDLRVREVGPGLEEGEELDSVAHTQAMVLAYFLLFMIYTALIMYGNMVASGVAEEKSSRIMEVMISTVRPLDLMLGKIIGVGALGLLQYTIWISTALLMTAMGRSGMVGTLLGIGEPLSIMPLSTVLWFGVFFILGYFFYASIFAAAGALVSRVEEVSQVVSILMMLIMVGFFGAYISFLNPNSSFAVVASLIPFTAPMVMFARLVLANPPALQVLASVAILVVSVFAGAWTSARIYRIGVLLYGKRPTIRQVMRLLKDS